MVRILFACLILVVLIGCGGAKLSTQSGKPEIDVHCANKEIIRAVINERMVNKDYIVMNMQDDFLAYRKKVQGVGGFVADVLSSVARSSQKITRSIENYYEVHYVMMPVAGSTRIVTYLLRTEIDEYGHEKKINFDAYDTNLNYLNDVMIPMKDKIEKECEGK